MKNNHQRGIALSLVSLLAGGFIAAGMSGCEKEQAQVKQSLYEVGVYTLKAQPVTLTREFPGRTSAYRIAEVRARVSGIVLKRMFTEGSIVKEGQQLYQIDPEVYQATLDSAKAQLAQAEANLISAKSVSDRYERLVKTEAISKQDYDTAIAATKAAEAAVAAAKAAVVQAEIDLAYTKVYSPITGRIGKSEVTEGAYVQAGTATLLAVVQQIDPMYVDLEQPAGQMLKLKRDLESGKLQQSENGKAKVTLSMSDGHKYEQEGSLQFSDITVSTGTSSIMVRAEFPNPDGNLLPGLFVRARLMEGVLPQAILAPQQGVSRNQHGDPIALVAVKNDKGQTVVEQRSLKVDRSIGDKWLVEEGLKAGDQLIVEGLQFIRAGMPVSTVPAGTSPGSLPISE